MREMKVQLHSIFTFAQDAPDALPKGTVSIDEATWASKLIWMLQRKGKICPCQVSNYNSLVAQSLLCHYTDDIKT
jgi:hypothetical protein